MKIVLLMPVRALFTLSILLSAFLLFLIQPMLSKIILPQLGGSPAVWQTAMMFYQALLLGGYVYAHASTRWLGTRMQSRLHGALLLVSFAALPISLYATSLFAPTAEPVSFLLVSLLLTIGLPFFVLSANAPLVQHWYASHHATRQFNPYVLYSASNLGSFAALLAYPFLIEYLFSLSAQTELWSALYAVFGLLLLLCVFQINKHFVVENDAPETAGDQPEDTTTPTLKNKLHWVVLAFIPSSLMLGVTTHVTTDIAAVPLLWVMPLALYLLTFVLAFQPKMPGYHFFLKEQVFIVAMLLIAMATRLDVMTPFQVLHFLAFFSVAMVCHGQLAISRPSARHLTGFYVWVSVGGACGGIFNALLAPNLFTSTMEYWIVLALACFFRPQTKEFERENFQRILDIVLPIGIIAILATQYQVGALLAQLFPEQIDTVRTFYKETFINRPLPKFDFLTIMFFIAICIVLPKFCQHRPVRFGYAVLVLFISIPYAQGTKTDKTIHRERNFFGISVITKREDPPLHIFAHGTTLHGMQSQKEEERLLLASYYIHVKDIFRNLPDNVRLLPVAVGGLGAGTLACLGQEQQEFDFYEIDEAVKNIAENPKLFTYLRDCPTRSTVQIADARLGLKSAPDGRYGAIFMDAYSSDSLPMHLITQEALAIYVQKLAPHGIVAFNISNRYLKLNQILANIAHEENLVAIERLSRPADPNAVPAHWVVMARSWNDLEATGYKEAGWTPLEPNGDRPWTDNYTNILGVLR